MTSRRHGDPRGAPRSSSVLFSGRDQRPEAFHTEVLRIAEIDADERIGTYVAFDPDDFDAAIAELDARYLAGEAAAHARTWSVITGGHAAVNRHELPPTTPDCVSIDHRRGTAFAPGELNAYFRAGWDLGQDIRTYVEVVHRLSDLGAVCTHAGHETSKEGFDAEWGGVSMLTIEGDMVNRSEVFDEDDLDAAIARFDQLSQPTPHLENTASRVDKRFQSCFAARDWDVMAEMLSGGFAVEDRRRVVNMGNLHGRDAELTVHAYGTAGTENVKSTVIATRGEHLVLNHYRFSGRDQRPDAFRIEMLVVVEIDADDRMAAVVVFDADDIDAAIAELDARYLAGEAAAHSHTWSLVADAFAAINRHELPELAPGWVNIDHRRGAAFATGEMTAYLTDLLDDTPDIKVYIEVVHRLSNLGAVVTQAGHGTSQEGFQAEWREIGIFMFDGDLLSRYELFDEADLDTALAKFEQLSRPAPQLENAASQVAERFLASFAARDWDAMAELLADDVFSDDRRAVIGAGIRTGPDAVIAKMRGGRRPRGHEREVRPSSRPAGAPRPHPCPILAQRQGTGGVPR